jgi:hypothetical protein
MVTEMCTPAVQSAVSEAEVSYYTAKTLKIRIYADQSKC